MSIFDVLDDLFDELKGLFVGDDEVNDEPPQQWMPGPLAAGTPPWGPAPWAPAPQVPNGPSGLQQGVDQAGTTDYTKIDYRPATAVVIGAEGEGLSDLVRKNCDFLAAIPMRGCIASLNASVAAAVILYEVLKQRS